MDLPRFNRFPIDGCFFLLQPLCVLQSKKPMKASHIYSVLVAASTAATMAQSQTSTDFWDISQGSIVTATSGMIPGYFAESAFGGSSSLSDWAYFADGQPAGFTHFVEWETPIEVTLGQVRLFAFGDGFLNNGREFDQFILKAKSPDSLAYDVTILTYIPTHPYTFVNPNTRLVIDEIVTPVVSKSFRAEFVQYTAGFNFDGPRIVELDGLPVPPPQITAQPESVVVNHAMPVLFSVTANASGALTYQWFKNGVPIAGQTNSTSSIPSATIADIGSYTVKVSNSISAITSHPATLTLDFLNVRQSDADLWDIRRGTITVAHSPLHPTSGSDIGLFGGITAAPESFFTYFGDNQATGTVHYVEWTTPNPVNVRTVRLFAFGDAGLNNSREFNTMTLRAKSHGSSNYDLVVATFTPSHPYTFLDHDLILDTEISPIQASAFRAEFVQYTAGLGFDGPRIVELDAFETRPLLMPVVVSGPESQTVPKNTGVNFRVLARGGNLNYQWKFMGQNVTGATNDSYTLKHAKSTDQGYYTVVVSNPAGTIETAQALLLVTPR